MGGVDNGAQLGGLVGGWVVARLVDPLKPERTNHVILAIVCLVASGLAIVSSLLIPMPVLE